MELVGSLLDSLAALGKPAVPPPPLVERKSMREWNMNCET